jgi:N-glycosylase/DNA lyase
MEIIFHEAETEIRHAADFDLEKTFNCGQCFRWHRQEGDPSEDAFIGVAYGRAARVRQTGEGIFISGGREDFESLWRDYFDIERDYDAIRKMLAVDPYMTRAAEYGAGIRILRQEPWEALCTFIVSQCNNIPRITQIVENLCHLFGEPVAFERETLYAFPAPEIVASLSEEDLAPLRSGYRAKYILGAARAVAEGRLDLEALKKAPERKAIEALKTLDGVGEKVAQCAALFGLGKLNAFPVDTWMKKALSAEYGGGVDLARFAPYAGIAQQYIFHYARSSARSAS